MIFGFRIIIENTYKHYDVAASGNSNNSGCTLQNAQFLRGVVSSSEKKPKYALG
jgi:hypothetical protein